MNKGVKVYIPKLVLALNFEKTADYNTKWQPISPKNALHCTLVLIFFTSFRSIDRCNNKAGKGVGGGGVGGCVHTEMSGFCRNMMSRDFSTEYLSKARVMSAYVLKCFFGSTVGAAMRLCMLGMAYSMCAEN